MFKQHSWKQLSKLPDLPVVSSPELLTVEMPDQQSGHHRQDSDEHQDGHDGQRLLGSLLLQLLAVWGRQELHPRVPAVILQNSAVRRSRAQADSESITASQRHSHRKETIVITHSKNIHKNAFKACMCVTAALRTLKITPHEFQNVDQEHVPLGSFWLHNLCYTRFSADITMQEGVSKL